MRDWCNAKARKDIRDSLTGRVSSIEVARYAIDLLRRDRPSRDHRRSLMLPAASLSLSLSPSDVAAYGDFRFRREVNETVESTSIAALRSAEESVSRTE